MSPDRWHKVEKIYHSVLEKPREQRVPYLDGACGSDAELRRQVEALISRTEAASSPLDRPAWELLETTSAPPGTQLGPYRLLHLAGTGGMGRVYKAIDTRLDRTVAIKTFRSHFTETFQREARAISALSHPNICTLFDVGPDYLVMEYIEGKPVSGPMRLDKALETAIAIAGALDAAHRAGFVHCDLKPANVLLTKAGPKLLDFGLARHRSDAFGSGADTIGGTLPYMAPEQLDGRGADARSDIYAAGLILYELIAGRRAIPLTASGPLVDAIRTETPQPLREVAPACPPALEYVIGRCLMKDPDERWQSAHDLKMQLEWIATHPGRPAAAASRRWAALATLVAVSAVALLFMVWWLRSPTPPPLVRFTLFAPLGEHFSTATPILLSPDGRHLLETTLEDNSAEVHHRLHHFATGGESELGVSVDGRYGPWSPDSQSLLLYLSERLLRIDSATGGQTEIFREPLTSAAVGAAGTYLLGVPDKGLLWATPGSRRVVVQRREKWEPAVATQILPGERKFLFWVTRTTPWQTWIGSVDGSAPAKVMNLPATYAWPGYLLFLNGESLVAQRFDVDHGQLSGAPRFVAPAVTVDLASRRGIFTVSDRGTLAFLHGHPQPQARYVGAFNREGRLVEQIGSPGDYWNPALSPDGHRLAVCALSASGTRQIVVFDLQRKTRMTLAADSPDNNNPAWSPDGSEIAYSAEHGGRHQVYVRSSNADGPERLLESSDVDINVLDWSHDGGWLLFNSASSRLGREVKEVSLRDRDAHASNLVNTGVRQDWASISPDGHWVLYRSFEKNKGRIHLRAFPPDDRDWIVSEGASRQGAWRGDSREIYFDRGGNLFGVELHVKAGQPELGPPKVLFPLPLISLEGRNWYSVSADGGTFYIVAAREKAWSPIEVVMNWPKLLENP
jgi:serine/threonine protein kinase